MFYYVFIKFVCILRKVNGALCKVNGALWRCLLFPPMMATAERAMGVFGRAMGVFGRAMGVFGRAMGVFGRSMGVFGKWLRQQIMESQEGH